MWEGEITIIVAVFNNFFLNYNIWILRIQTHEVSLHISDCQKSIDQIRGRNKNIYKIDKDQTELKALFLLSKKRPKRQFIREETVQRAKMFLASMLPIAAIWGASLCVGGGMGIARFLLDYCLKRVTLVSAFFILVAFLFYFLFFWCMFGKWLKLLASEKYVNNIYPLFESHSSKNLFFKTHFSIIHFSVKQYCTQLKTFS